jgi:uncharacterized membrane protein
VTPAWLYDLVLCLHVLSAFILVAGVVVAGVGFEVARRRAASAEIALLLGLTRIGALLVMAGALGAAGFGLWLVDLGQWGYSTPWVDVAITLLIVTTVVGAVAGQPAKRARRLAQSLAADSQTVSVELRALLDSRIALVLNYCSAVLLVGIIVDMLVKPGS